MKYNSKLYLLSLLFEKAMKQNAQERAQQKLCMELRQIKEAQSFLNNIRRTIK